MLNTEVCQKLITKLIEYLKLNFPNDKSLLLRFQPLQVLTGIEQLALIKEHVYPERLNLNTFISKILESNGRKISESEKVHLDKVKTYLEALIELI